MKLTTTLVPGALALGLGLAACAAQDDATGDLSQADTGPFQYGCPYTEGSGPGQCKTVPPLTKPTSPAPDTPWAPWEVDGAMGDHEYYGAVTFPYANPGMQVAGGKVIVAEDSLTLHVFLKDLPGPAYGSVRIYLDYQRSDGRSAETYPLPDGEDRAYDLDLASGVVTPMKAVTTAGFTYWVPIVFQQLCRPRFGCIPLGWADDVPPFDAKLGEVRPASAGDVARFDAEFSIGLRGMTLVKPSNVIGVGFAVSQLQPNGTTGIGAFPEQLALDAVSPPVGATQAPHDVDRTQWQTLLFGVPPGQNVTFTTFNVKRFTPFMHEVERLFGDDALDDFKIPSNLIGEYIAPFDVVALEEAWDPGKFDEILSAANAARVAMGRQPFFWVGPPREKDPGLFSKLSTLGLDENTGGVYILSRYPIARSDWEAYTTCRGEDCMKKKGVLWARIWFGGPGPDCNANLGCKPTGDAYVDVFATHLNADPEACGREFTSAGDYIKDFATSGALCAFSPEACFLYDIYTKVVFQCTSPPTNAEARAAQLAQMDAFINRVTSEDRTRPTIVMGDFNINGRLQSAARAGEWNLPEYENMVAALELVPPGRAGDMPSTDWVNPWHGPYGWDWDVDHADIVRETVSDFDMVEGAGATTSIGRDRGPDDVSDRYDYVFVRPGTRPEDPAFTTTKWVVAKGSRACSELPGCDSYPGSTAPVWRAPFPYASTPVDSVGNRLSDHKPVVANLKMVQMEVPPVYHPTWRHSYELRVTSASSDDHDCFLGSCGGLDLYGNLASQRLSFGSWATDIHHTSTCDSTNAVSWPASDCMGDWRYNDLHDPASVTALAGGSELWDADSTSADDFYSTVPGQRAPIMQTDWAAATVWTRGWLGGAVPSCPAVPVTDNAAIPCCTRDGNNFLCLLTQWTELLP